MATFVDLATNLFYLNGAPLKMPHDTMRHIYPIYNNPDRSVLMMFGRQVHKSTTLANNIALPCIKYKNYHAVYVAPTSQQTSVFSTDKLDGTLRDSTIIQKHFIDTKTKDQVMYKELLNGSKIYLRSAFHSADSIRGISADKVAIDELQDIMSDHIPVIEQCMSFSLPKWESMKQTYPNLPMHLFNHRTYAGTPKTIENTLSKYWGKSTQNEWLIKCSHCNKWNYINEKNVGPTCLICNKCGLPIHYKDGQWVSTSHDKKASIQGYRVPQIIVDWINNPRYPEVWQINVIQPMKIYTSQKFFNEILALPYANAKNPLNHHDMHAICKDYEINIRWDDPILANVDLYAGVDWGKGDTAKGTSYTVLKIGGIFRGKFRLFVVRKYTGRMSDANYQIEDILRTINLYKCKLTMADSGDGRTSNATMVKALGVQRFCEAYEHGTSKKKIKWDPAQGMYIFNRTRMMTDRFMEIKSGQIEFPKYEQMKDYIEDFLNIYVEYSERTRLTMYDHTGPDDCFHAYMFCRIACMIGTGELSKYLAGGDNEEPLI